MPIGEQSSSSNKSNSHSPSGRENNKNEKWDDGDNDDEDNLPKSRRNGENDIDSSKGPPVKDILDIKVVRIKYQE